LDLHHFPAGSDDAADFAVGQAFPDRDRNLNFAGGDDALAAS
jgi:hypothetical protein